MLSVRAEIDVLSIYGNLLLYHKTTLCRMGLSAKFCKIDVASRQSSDNRSAEAENRCK